MVRSGLAVAGPALRQLARGGTAVKSLSGRELDVLKQLARGGSRSSRTVADLLASAQGAGQVAA